MLSEEALIILAAFGACGLLVLGVLELVWPTRPRHPLRRYPPIAARSRRPHRVSARARHALEPGRDRYQRRTPILAGLPPAPSTPPGEPAPPVPVPAAATAALTDAVVEACFALYQDRRYAEVLASGTAALADTGPARLTGPSELAALWSVVALARQALGEDGEARTALEAAIAAAPAADRPPYQRQLAALADSVAQGLLAEAQRHPNQDSEECLAAIRSAAAWLECGAAAMPTDSTLAEQAAGARALLWPGYERLVMGLAQRQDFRAARRLLREVLADPRLPPGRSDTFRELFSGTFSGEIGRLTAQAIRSMQEAREADALRALQRAERLLETLRDEALSPERRAEVDRRLWWGYSKLGERRVTAGDYEGALEPLLHALDYDVGPARQQETRALLLRALDGVADARTLGIGELADAGDREAAIVQCDTLWALLRGANERGLTLTELSATYRKVQRLFESLGRA